MTKDELDAGTSDYNTVAQVTAFRASVANNTGPVRVALNSAAASVPLVPTLAASLQAALLSYLDAQITTLSSTFAADAGTSS